MFTFESKHHNSGLIKIFTFRKRYYFYDILLIPKSISNANLLILIYYRFDDFSYARLRSGRWQYE